MSGDSLKRGAVFAFYPTMSARGCWAHGEPLYTVVVLAISTGARQNEIMSLRWPEVDLQRGLVILHETKNGERRALPLHGHALECVQRLSKVRRLDTDLLFPYRRNPQRPLNIRNVFVAAMKKAKIENFRFHDLRHSCASYLAMNGASLAEIAKVLGHKTLAMRNGTHIYRMRIRLRLWLL